MAVFNDNEKQKLKDFFNACNEMIDGRFILSDIKISKILNAIANSTVIYDLVAKCMVDFNFKSEFRNAKVSNKTNGGYFVLPTDETKIVALVFCFLLEVDNNHINLQNFINENFYNADGYNISYSNFALNMLVPFKNSVLNLLNINENGEEVKLFNEEVTTNQIVMDGFGEEDYEVTPDEKILYANLLRALNQLFSAVKREEKIKEDNRAECIIVIKAIKEAIHLENLKIINALIIPLNYIIGKNKRLKPYFDDLQESLLDFYK